MENFNNKKLPISLFSSPNIVLKNAMKYLGPDVKLRPSDYPKKKYMVFNPNTKKWVHFGAMGYEDYTLHNDDERRKNYLKRSANIRGNWKDDPYSPNNLSRNILW